MFVLVLVRVHHCAESDQVVRGLLVLDTKVSSTVNLGGEGRVLLVAQRPVDHHGVVLIRLKEPFLMGGQRGPVLLVGASVEGARVEVAVEAHAGFKEGIRTLDVVANERGQLLAALPVGDSEEVAWSVRKLLETTLEIPLPTRARVDARLRLPVFFVFVEAL
jgi:hypothetical protein